MLSAGTKAGQPVCARPVLRSISPVTRTKTLWLKAEYLQQILRGQKTVEVRVAYSNITRLRPGDILLLNNRHPFAIVNIRRYDNFEQMVAAEDVAAVAPDLPNGRALLAACRAIYPPEKEALGVVALEIEPCPGNEQGAW